MCLFEVLTELVYDKSLCRAKSNDEFNTVMRSNIYIHESMLKKYNNCSSMLLPAITQNGMPSYVPMMLYTDRIGLRSTTMMKFYIHPQTSLIPKSVLRTIVNSIDTHNFAQLITGIAGFIVLTTVKYYMLVHTTSEDK